MEMNLGRHPTATSVAGVRMDRGSRDSDSAENRSQPHAQLNTRSMREATDNDFDAVLIDPILPAGLDDTPVDLDHCINADQMGWISDSAPLYAAAEPGYSEEEHNQFYRFLRDNNIQFAIDLRPSDDIFTDFNDYYPTQAHHSRPFREQTVTTVHATQFREIQSIHELMTQLALEDIHHLLNQGNAKSDSILSKSFWLNLLHPKRPSQLYNRLSEQACFQLMDLNLLMKRFKLSGIEGLTFLSNLLKIDRHAQLLRLKIENNNGNTERGNSENRFRQRSEHYVTLLHYTQWPDFSVIQPRHLTALGELLHSQAEAKVPSLVHCRGGLGRTGTLITYAQIARYFQHHGLLPSTSSARPTTATPTSQEIKKFVLEQIHKNRSIRKHFVETEAQVDLIIDTLVDTVASHLRR